MESNSPDVLLVPYISEMITEYAVSTETTTVAAPSTTFRTISVKKFGTASTSSSVQKKEDFSVEAAAVTSSENTLTSTNSSASYITSSSSWRSSTNSSSLISNTSVAVRPTMMTPISTPNQERAASTSSSRIGSSTNADVIIQIASLTPPPTILPTSTETLLALPTTSAPRFTHSPLPSPSQEPPSRKPLTIAFTTLGSVSLAVLLVTFFFFRRRRRRWDGKIVEGLSDGRRNERRTWSIKKCERSGRRTVYELITSANVHEKDGESVDLSTKPATPLKCCGLREGSLRRSSRSGSSLGGCLKEGMKGSFRRGRERIYELECEEREEVNWMSLKNRVRERTVERLGSSLGMEGRRGVREGVSGRGRAKTGKSVRWAVG